LLIPFYNCNLKKILEGPERQNRIIYVGSRLYEVHQTPKLETQIWKSSDTVSSDPFLEHRNYAS